jgi:hypothetical protein
MTEQRQVLRGFLANVDVLPPLIVTFQFNPDSLRDDKAVTYVPRTDAIYANAPGREYVNGGDRTISFDLELHGLEQGTDRINPTPVGNGVSTELAKLRSFLYPAASAWDVSKRLLAADTGVAVLAPPTCLFGFGTRVLECVVTELRVNERQFNSQLAPVRAGVSVTLVVIEDDANALYRFDTQQRNLLAAVGFQNIRIFG